MWQSCRSCWVSLSAQAKPARALPPYLVQSLSVRPPLLLNDRFANKADRYAGRHARDRATDADTDADHMHIRFQNQSGNYLPDIVAISVHRDAAQSQCGVRGPQTQAAQVGDIFGEGATTYEITQEALTDIIRPC
jgi:hypothetical protein